MAISEDVKTVFGVGGEHTYGPVTIKPASDGEGVTVTLCRELAIISVSMSTDTLANIIEDWIFREPS